jgi:hypothetical protein
VERGRRRRFELGLRGLRRVRLAAPQDEDPQLLGSEVQHAGAVAGALPVPAAEIHLVLGFPVAGGPRHRGIVIGSEEDAPTHTPGDLYRVPDVVSVGQRGELGDQGA